MSSLDLKMEGPAGHTLTDKTFHLLRGFLQPDTTLTLQLTAQSILDLLPEKDLQSTEIWSFGEIYIEVAEQIPYHHPSQLKLVALLEYLGRTTKLGDTHASKENTLNTNTGQYGRYQRLGESLRASLTGPVKSSYLDISGIIRLVKAELYAGPDPENPSQYINFHAFAANLHERRIFATNPTWAIWVQREAHETRREAQGGMHDVYVLAAAQWILWYGQSFFKQVLFPGVVSSDDLRHWSSGPLYDGKAHLSLQRWRFWRDGFNAAASEKREEEKGFGQECKVVAAKAADMMDLLEKNMMI